MKRVVLLLVCALVVNVLILGLAVKNRRLTEQVDDLKIAKAQEQQRLNAALTLLDRASAELDVANPAQAEVLRVDTGIVRHGDLGFFRPSPDDRFIFRFDELL